MPLNLIFKALADANRRKILQLLQQGDLTAGEIAAQFEISKPSISHHLNILKQANLVQDFRRGQNIFYSLNTTVFQDMIAWFYNVSDLSGGIEKSSGHSALHIQDKGDRHDDQG